MKNINILGVSEDSIAIIFELLKEVFHATEFTLYPNNLDNNEPSLPWGKMKYKIMPLGSAPRASEKVFFGCATPQFKQNIYTFFNEKHQVNTDNFYTIIHPSSYVSESSIISNGVMIEPHVVISSQSRIGFGVYIKRGSLIGHHNEIGDFSDINPGVTISGRVTIGIGCTIGSGVVIKNNINIGNNSVIGVGSVVTKNIPANCIAYGNPCKVIRLV